MDRNKLKAYAPKARRDFIKAVTNRVAYYGLTKDMDKVEAITQEGDVAIITGKPFPRAVAEKRKRLEERIKKEGFEQVMEAMAYTWFNRFVAIRFMELHGYLDHGYRVLSHPRGNTIPEIVEHAEHINLPGLDKDKVIELKMEGTKETELYRMLLIGQCNALHQAMPFLFEKIGDYTELFMPDNLLHSNSPIRNLVNEIPEENWQEIEIIGWLYQFYISEKKDQVIGKVVKSEDIPAATQLFTPNWIVKYMVQNSLGAQWLATYPQSPLKGQMAYYIEPAEQTDEVKAQLAAITPSTLNPEGVSLIDPASGSGHILVEAYELFKAIYLERGYRQADVAQLILTQNLFGLDIDGRAAQLTGFALMMKGRADDRRLFERGVKLNVMALVDSAGFDAEGLAKGVELGDFGLQPGDLTELKRLFEHATTFGSLIQVPEGLAEKLPALMQLSEATSQDMFVSDALKRLGPLVQQAELLAGQYDAVVANPPYMGSKGMNVEVKKFAKDHFPNGKGDLFACFIERGFKLAKTVGHNAMVTMESWMFLSSYEDFRRSILQRHTMRNLAHFPYDGKRPTAMGINFGVAVIAVQCSHIAGYRGHYCCSRYYELSDSGVPFTFPTPNERLRTAATDDFRKVPGSPVAYWVPDTVREVFARFGSIQQHGKACSGHQTGDNEQFLRQWFELPVSDIGFVLSNRDEALASGSKWFPHKKGGPFRRWYGNRDYVMNWASNGAAIRQHKSSALRNPDYMFKPGVTWSHTSSGTFSARLSETGDTFNVEGPTYFSANDLIALGFFCSPVALHLMQIMNPTMHFLVGSVSLLPYHPEVLGDRTASADAVLGRITDTYRADWNAYERSWDFQSLPLLTASSDPTPTLEFSYTAWVTQNRDKIAEMKRLEEENNRLFIDAYGLADELTPGVPIEQITLTVNPAYRYGGKLTEEEQWTRFRQDTMEELVSYAIGCMMGRYSLDVPGLIYAHSGNEDFDPSRYTTFPADGDGIVPLTDTEWFDDDAAHRLIEFISVAWNESHLEDNFTFLADNLSPKKKESSRETLRRYLCDSFFKDHLQTYKKRPIYWLFSSGKQKAFQCLVYLHRYNEGTLSRMRTEYVIPLQGKISARVEQLSGDITAAANSTAHRKKLERERDKLIKQQVELQTFDEKLRHYADKRISLDLDDGVKVNYGKFGDLLSEVKAVTGRQAD